MTDIDLMNKAMPESPNPAVPVFLVMERDALIAEDIIG
jgi:hypothetical protein